jgi:hypothetical protein
MSKLEKNYFLNRARDNTFFNALVSADKGYTPLNLSCDQKLASDSSGLSGGFRGIGRGFGL